jgi:hypothetical protein
MGDLPRWKIEKKNMKWSRYNGWPTQMEDGGLIVMGDLPRKMMFFFSKKWSHCYGWPTQKNVGEGSKAHSKGSRVIKRTTWEVRAQRRTQNEVGLENALPQKVMMKHRYDNVENNALWSICMYTYLRNIGPHFFMVSFFSQKLKCW